MLTRFIKQKLKKARYRKLADGTYYGEIPGIKGVWANARDLEDCREELREVLEEWLILKVQSGERITGFPKFGQSKTKTFPYAENHTA